MVVSKPLVLLGQYNLLAPHQGDIYHQPEAPMEENDDDTLGESDNVMARVELHNGLLWIENDEALPLLASTQVLLEYLGHSIPTKEEGPGTVVMPIAEPSKGQPNESRAEEAKQEDPKDERENGKDENGLDGKEDVKKEDSDGNGAKEAVTKPQMRPEHAALQSLERITDLTPSKIRPAVGDIRKLRQRDYSKQKSRGERMTAEEMRLVALENQRERLQRQKSEQSDDNDEDPDQQEVGKSDADDDDGENVDGEDPWLTIVRTLNSLQVLLPVLIPILFHPERNAKDLTIGSANIQATKRRRGGRCWLLGKYKFDVTSVGECKFVYRQLEEIMGFLGTSNESEVPSWPDTVEHTMRTCLRVSTEASPELVSHVPNYPWVGPFEGKDQTVIQRLTNALDKKFGIHDTSDPAERESYLKAIETLHSRVHALLKKAYKDARLSIYGSCLSDLSLGKSSDVDMSLHIEKMRKTREDFEEGRTNPSKYQKDVKSHVYKVCRQLEHLREEFGGMDPVWRARIPVVRGTYKKAENPYSDDGSLNFDICFLNDIAVANSELLREYSLVDIRVKQLMVEVKRWAAANGLNSAKDNFLSSYAWMNMVIFFLQCIGFVPNLQSAELMEKVGFKRDAKNYWHNINSLETHFLKWEMAREVWELPPTLSTLSVTGLLYGFFRFYASDFPRAFLMVSVKRGKESLLPKTLFRKHSLFLSIEDPFETYDSHCPHDLGTPVNEIGDCIIVKCLQEAEMFLRDALLRALDEKDETAQSTLVDSLWRKPSERKSGNTGEKGKNNQFGGRSQKSKQQPKQQQKQKQQPIEKQQQKRQPKEQPKQQQKQKPKGGPKDQPTEQQKQQQQKQKATGEDDKNLVELAPPSAATLEEPQAVAQDPSRAEVSEVEISQGATNEVAEVVIEAASTDPSKAEGATDGAKKPGRNRRGRKPRGAKDQGASNGSRDHGGHDSTPNENNTAPSDNTAEPNGGGGGKPRAPRHRGRGPKQAPNRTKQSDSNTNSEAVTDGAQTSRPKNHRRNRGNKNNKPGAKPSEAAPNGTSGATAPIES